MTKMKATKLITSLLTATLLAGAFTSSALAKDKDEAKLEAEAKVSKADAEKTALAKVPGGTVKESELEKEKGKLIWSCDISTPDSKDITEVAVDATTGEVVSVEKETPADQAKEKAEDAKEEKKGKHDKDDDEKEEKGEHKH
jgi:uncharacterized membrane protein YkoI